MITTKWKDFVLSTGAPITSVQERFNVNSPGRKVEREVFEKFGEVFEAMDVTDLGGITVWTTHNVWCIRQETGLEKLIYLPRNPS